MSYATVDAMLKKFGERQLIELTDNETPYTGQINMDKLDAANEEANSEVDGYISRFLPLQTIPPFLINIACNLSRFHACTTMMTENDPIKIKYDNSIKTLKLINKGELSLGGTPAGSKSVPTSADNVVFKVGRRDFGNGGW